MNLTRVWFLHFFYWPNMSAQQFKKTDIFGRYQHGLKQKIIKNYNFPQFELIRKQFLKKYLSCYKKYVIFTFLPCSYFYIWLAEGSAAQEM